MKEKDKDRKEISFNKKAHFNYTVEDKLECGIELVGTEVKSIKLGQIAYGDSYAKVENDELWLVGLHITPYAFGSIYNHDPDRNRKLLAHKMEIKRLKRKIMEKGLTLVPLRFYLKKGLVKLELAICKGKKLADKREVIKDRDQRREIAREFRIK
jgi:SsrA-binding protein